MGNFAGTAEYYEQYREQLPQEVVDFILSAVPHPTSLLDLGTGTGHILEQFAPDFSSIVVVEPERDMLKRAHKRLMAYPVEFVNSTAEDAKLPDGWTASLVTIAHAFHWMNRPVVLRKLETVVAPGGVIAVIGGPSFWEMHHDWTAIVRETIQEFLGTQRRTLAGTYQNPERPFADDFAESAFSFVEERRFHVTRHWTANQIIGWLYSSSYASKALLKEDAPRFEERLCARLAALSPQDLFEEQNHIDVLLAMRPAG